MENLDEYVLIKPFYDDSFKPEATSIKLHFYPQAPSNVKKCNSYLVDLMQKVGGYFSVKVDFSESDESFLYKEGNQSDRAIAINVIKTILSCQGIRSSLENLQEQISDKHLGDLLLKLSCNIDFWSVRDSFYSILDKDKYCQLLTINLYNEKDIINSKFVCRDDYDTQKSPYPSLFKNHFEDFTIKDYYKDIAEAESAEIHIRKPDFGDVKISDYNQKLKDSNKQKWNGSFEQEPTFHYKNDLESFFEKFIDPSIITDKTEIDVVNIKKKLMQEIYIHMLYLKNTFFNFSILDNQFLGAVFSGLLFNNTSTLQSDFIVKLKVNKLDCESYSVIRSKKTGEIVCFLYNAEHIFQYKCFSEECKHMYPNDTDRKN